MCKLRGSVFPQALAVAIPCALLAAALKYFAKDGNSQSLKQLNDDNGVLNNNAAWNGFTFLVGFLIVFRTSQSYARFWDGCIWLHTMRAEWFDACASVLAFTKASKAEERKIHEFKELLTRLFSMLHAVALGEIEDVTRSELANVAAFHMDLIDPTGIDSESLAAIKNSDCKVEMVFQWIQQIIIENIATGVLTVPPPILSRSFQVLGNGMHAFHQAIKISYIPFPFPYAQICDTLLVMHWMVAPIVCAQWTTEAYWAGVFAFIQVFILWALNLTALEIEHPFGLDDNDIDAEYMQKEMNRHLMVLVHPATLKSPSYVVPAARKPKLGTSRSFIECWQTLGSEDSHTSSHMDFKIHASREVSFTRSFRRETCSTASAGTRRSSLLSGQSRRTRSKKDSETISQSNSSPLGYDASGSLVDCRVSDVSQRSHSPRFQAASSGRSICYSIHESPSEPQGSASSAKDKVESSTGSKSYSAQSVHKNVGANFHGIGAYSTSHHISSERPWVSGSPQKERIVSLGMST